MQDLAKLIHAVRQLHGETAVFESNLRASTRTVYADGSDLNEDWLQKFREAWAAELEKLLPPKSPHA